MVAPLNLGKQEAVSCFNTIYPEIVLIFFLEKLILLFTG